MSSLYAVDGNDPVILGLAAILLCITAASVSSKPLSERLGKGVTHEHPYPLRGCNSNLAQYSNTPARNASRSDAGGPTIHHSACPDPRTKTTTRTKRLVSAKRVCELLALLILRLPVADEASSVTFCY